MIDQQGADALVGEQFQQHGVIDAAVDDMHAGHAAFERIGGAAGFRDHAAGNGAVGNQIVYVFYRQAGQQFALLIQNAGGIGQQNQFLGFQNFGHFARYQIGIDVIGMAVFADPDRRNDRNEIAADRACRPRPDRCC